MKLQLCRDSVLFPSPPPFRRRTPCNSPELSPFGSECLGEAGQKITRCLKIPILPHQIRQREEDRARCGGRRTSGQRRGVNPSHTAHPLDPGSATVSERHWYSVLSGLVIPMADTTLEEALAGEQGGMGGRLRWTQPCMRQAVHREPKKWPRSGPGVQARTSKNQNSPENAARERSRVRNLRQAFQSLQAALPSVPPDTKLSKLDVLVLATNYIAHLTETLDQDQGGAVCDHLTLQRAEGYLHPVKKWPMRSLLYCGNIGERLTGPNPSQEECRTPSSTAEVQADRTDLDVSNHS